MSFSPSFRRLALPFIASALALSTIPMPAQADDDLLSGLFSIFRPNCGPAVPKPTGGNWTCTFADEFDGWWLGGSWTALTTGASGFTNAGECFTDRPENVLVTGGVLRLTVRREPAPISCPKPGGGSFTTSYSGGGVTTWSKLTRTYGRFEIRARFPSSKVPGLQSALWLFPQNPTYGPWPASGEIDIAEFFTTYPDRAIPYVHYNEAAPDPNVTNNYCYVSQPEAWHVYVLEWTSETITVKYDGKTCIVDRWQAAGLNRPAPFDHPFFLNLTQALGVGTNAVNGQTPLPASTEVDYVRIWS